ncbi:hypothetical protein G9C84_15915 [Halolamina sp. R1-12]|nr:hypothetical protein [Halolamina sp. R1-12]
MIGLHDHGNTLRGRDTAVAAVREPRSVTHDHGNTLRGRDTAVAAVREP